MSARMITESQRQKWKPVLDKEATPSKGLSRADIFSRLLENQEQWCKQNLTEGSVQLNESGEPINQIGVADGVSGAAGSIKTWTPTLIKMAKRLPPNLVAFDFFGVQPMTGPDGQVFALRSRYNDNTGAGETGVNFNDSEALVNEALTGFSGNGVQQTGDTSGFPLGHAYKKTGATTQPAVPGANPAFGQGMGVDVAQKLGSTSPWSKMGITIEKSGVTAKSRGLYADYSHELRQDMLAVHGEDVDSILTEILLQEIQAEMNREFIRTMNTAAEFGYSGTAYDRNAGDTGWDTVRRAGVLNISTDLDGRWALERWKGLLFRIELEANAIAKRTRRGKGNKMITSSNVASAMMLTGMLDFSPALATQGDMVVDDTGQTYVGKLANGVDVFIDPWAELDYFTIGYKGQGELDAGAIFCPYIPVEMYRANDTDSFQPRMGFKTRYGLIANPFVSKKADGTDLAGKGLGAQENAYFRKVAVLNLTQY